MGAEASPSQAMLGHLGTEVTQACPHMKSFQLFLFAPNLLHAVLRNKTNKKAKSLVFKEHVIVYQGSKWAQFIQLRLKSYTHTSKKQEAN